MALVNITGTLVLPDGSVMSSSQFIVRRVHGQAVPDLDNVILPSDVSMTTDSSGDVNIDLHSGQYVVLYGPYYSTAKYFFMSVPDDGRTAVSISDVTPEPIPDGAGNVYYTKRGDTIKFGCVYLDQYGVQKPLAGTFMGAAMEHETTGHRVAFTATVISAAQGRFDLQLSASTAQGLELGWYNFDVRFSDGINVKHTHSGRIHVAKEIA